jgi:uncharacterized protein (UPF0276 family)
MSMLTQRQRGAGIEWAEAIEEEILAALDEVDCVELIPENFFGGRRSHFLRRLGATGKPVMLHGVELSIGTAGPLKQAHLDEILRVADQVNTIDLSDHLCLTEAGGVEVGQLTPLPCTFAAADAVCRNVDAIQARIPWPFLIENIAHRFAFPSPQMSEPDFIDLVLRRTGCHLLLDLHNLHANAENFQFDPFEWLAALDLRRVAAVHLAGGHVDDEGALVDGHDNPVPPRVWDLYAQVCREGRPRSAIVERGENFPPSYSELLDEVARARRILLAGHDDTEQAPIARGDRP